MAGLRIITLASRSFPLFAIVALVSEMIASDPAISSVPPDEALNRLKAELGELASKVQIVAGYYDLDTGKVEWTEK